MSLREYNSVLVNPIYALPYKYIQDSLSMDQWMEAKEAAASAKVTKLILVFDAESRQRARAIQAITDGLATNTFVRDKLLM